MTGSLILVALLSLAVVPVFWLLPRGWGEYAVAAFTLCVVAYLSPVSAAWLGGTTLLTPILMRIGERLDRRGVVTAGWTAVLVAMLFGFREVGTLVWIGGAYFTLRHIHVLMDWWMGRLPLPEMRAYIRYQLFLPVILAGPIHRFQNFSRECARRRWAPELLFRGAERTLWGFWVYVVAAIWLIGQVEAILPAPSSGGVTAFLADWLRSAVGWVELYLGFSGLTSIAIGLGLMLGIKVEENFDRPWAAANLVEFWSRWHMTLSHWCRDYVFQAVTALTRLPLVGLVAAMLAMGLWHETSAYYVCWAIWQAAGIAIARIAMKVGERGFVLPMSRLLGRVFTFVWLTLTYPVISRLLEALS